MKISDASPEVKLPYVGSAVRGRRMSAAAATDGLPAGDPGGCQKDDREVLELELLPRDPHDVLCLVDPAALAEIVGRVLGSLTKVRGPDGEHERRVGQEPQAHRNQDREDDAPVAGHECRHPHLEDDRREQRGVREEGDAVQEAAQHGDTPSSP